MALRTPPSWLQNGSHPADNDRLTTQALYSTTGVVGSTSMAVSAQVSPNMTVNVAAGWCAVAGSSANSGVYVAYNDATTILSITTANPTLPRVDRIVLTIQDAFYSGAANTVIFQVLAGTPAASPSAPATPSDSISLATVAVAAAASNITAGNITDTRVGATSNAFLPLTGGTVTGTTTHSGATVFSGTVTASNTIASTSTIAASSFIPLAGTASVAPLKFTSGTNLTAAQAGALEYNGSSFFLTSSTTAGRALILTDNSMVNMSTRTLSSTTSSQVLGPTGSNAISLPAGTYWWEIICTATTGSVAHNTTIGLGLAGATVGNSITWSVSSQGQAAPFYTYASSTSASPSVTLFAGTSTATITNISVRGLVSFTGTATCQPTIQFSAAPGGTNQVEAGSIFKIVRVPTGGTGNWS